MWTDNPSERAAARTFRREWIRRAWQRAWESGRRFGLPIGALVGAAVGIVEALVGDGVNLLILAVSIAGGACIIFFGTLVVALLWAPARVAWEIEHEDAPDTDQLVSVRTNAAGTINPTILTFVTRHREGTTTFRNLFPAKYSIRRIRFIEPEEVSFTLDELPITLRTGRWPRHGRVIIKAIEPEVFLVEFIKTHGVMCLAEVYITPRDEMQGQS